MKQPIDETTRCWNNKLMKQLAVGITNRWKSALLQKVGEPSIWQSYTLTKQHVEKITGSWNSWLIRLLIDEMKIRQMTMHQIKSLHSLTYFQAINVFKVFQWVGFKFVLELKKFH